MSLLTFTYSILLIILYTIALTSTGIAFYKTKRPTYLYSVIMFALIIVDHIIIYMTEIFSGFSHFYDETFMTTPAFKTIIMIGTAITYYLIHCALIENKKRTMMDYMILIVYAVYLMLIPLFPDSALKVWLYYLPYQLYLLYLSTNALYHMKQAPDCFRHPFFKNYKKLMIVIVILSFLIVAEDSIVIFNFDTYTSFKVNINNRSVSEDIMTSIFSIFAISCGFRQIVLTKETFRVPLKSLTPLEIFSKKYELTSREQQIMAEILNNKSNADISESLFISLGTTKTHIHNIYQKVNVTKRSQLLRVFHETTDETSTTED